ncbi:MAG: hypothetical protein JW889_16165 [Verrucomicrobia bacterium]|nr:hypothetical protein [Verrucomicrobiota bacterium]
MRRTRRLLGFLIAMLVIFCLPSATRALHAPYNPPIFISDIVFKYDPDGEPITGKYIAAGSTVYAVAETIYDLDPTPTRDYARDRIVSAAWYCRDSSDGEWRELPGGTLVETDYHVYRSYVRIQLGPEETAFSVRIRADDAGGDLDDTPGTAGD